MKNRLCPPPECKNHFKSTSIKNHQYLQGVTGLILRRNNFNFKQLNNFDLLFFKLFSVCTPLYSTLRRIQMTIIVDQNK